MTSIRCTGCGRTDLAVEAFICTWPDGRVTLERHCGHCALIWGRQLRALGATLEPEKSLAQTSNIGPSRSGDA